jgi:hypothetical protein
MIIYVHSYIYSESVEKEEELEVGKELESITKTTKESKSAKKRNKRNKNVVIEKGVKADIKNDTDEKSRLRESSVTLLCSYNKLLQIGLYCDIQLEKRNR